MNSSCDVDMKSAQETPKNDSMQGSCSTKRKISTTDMNTPSSKKHKKEEKCQSKPKKNKSTVLSRRKNFHVFVIFRSESICLLSIECYSYF